MERLTTYREKIHCAIASLYPLTYNGFGPACLLWRAGWVSGCKSYYFAGTATALALPLVLGVSSTITETLQQQHLLRSLTSATSDTTVASVEESGLQSAIFQAIGYCAYKRSSWNNMVIAAERETLSIAWHCCWQWRPHSAANGSTHCYSQTADYAWMTTQCTSRSDFGLVPTFANSSVFMWRRDRCQMISWTITWRRYWPIRSASHPQRRAQLRTSSEPRKRRMYEGPMESDPTEWNVHYLGRQRHRHSEAMLSSSDIRVVWRGSGGDCREKDG